jgi:hypothetical protein
MTAETQEFQQRFLSWFDAWGRDLWQVCVYASRSPESVEDEFPELLEMTMKRMRTKFRASTGEAWAAHFIGQWLHLQRIRNPRTGLSATDIPLVDRCVLAALFKVGWSLERTALVLGMSVSSLRFRTLQTLKLIAHAAPGSFDVRSRDCSRYDLHAIDGVLGVGWKDPLSFFDGAAHDAHRASCPRCGVLGASIDESLQHLHSLKIAPIPPRLRESLAEAHSFASRSIIVSWFSTWPWFLRVPVQLTFVAFVVFAVVTVPYVGDLFPELKQKFPSYAHWISQSILPSSELETRLKVRAESEAAGGKTPPPVVEPSAAPEVAGLEEHAASGPRLAQLVSAPRNVQARSEDYAVVPPWRVGPVPDEESAVAQTVRGIALHEAPESQPSTKVAEAPKKPKPVLVATKPERVAKNDVAKTQPSNSPLLAPPAAVRIATPMSAPSTALAPPKLVANATDPSESTGVEPLSSSSLATAAPVQPAPPVVQPKAGTSDLRKAFYRWGAFSGKLDEDSPRILALLQKHSVSNAGGLELGARHLGGLYYHFYVDNAALDLLVAELSALGLADFSRTKATGIRDDHPPGKTRVVFLVKPGHHF